MRLTVFILAVLVFVAIGAEIYLAGFHFGARYGNTRGHIEAAKEERVARLSFILDRMAFYESSYNVTARGDCDAGRCLAVGLYQFHHPTFNHLAHLAGYTNLSWKNPEHQYRVIKWALQHGYGRLWGATYHRALHEYFMKMEKENDDLLLRQMQGDH